MKNISILLCSISLLAFTFSVNAQHNMGDGDLNTCTDSIFDSGGPNGNYSNNELITETYCSDQGDCISLNFIVFDVENNFDDLTIYDGPTTASPVIGTFTGTDLQGMIINSTTGCLTLEWDSDFSVTDVGWVAIASCDSCPPPPPPCTDNDLRFNMFDTFGDGWNGATYTLTGQNTLHVESGTLAAGSAGTDSICIPDDCYEIVITSGTFPTEIDWTITNTAGDTLAFGGAPDMQFLSVGGVACVIPGCTDPAAFNFDPAANSDDGSCQFNDSCTTADPISCGDTIAGTTVGANSETLGPCGTTDGTGGAVWYTFIGNGQTVTVSTDNPGTNFDTKLRVWEGTCDSLVCVDGDDDGGAGLTSEVTFGSTLGTQYFFLVHGFSSAEGDFELSVVCQNAPNNDVPCGAAFVGFPTPVGITFPYDLSLATADPGEVDPGGGTVPGASCNSQDGWCLGFTGEPGVQNSLWFVFIAPANGNVDIVSDGGDNQLALWLVSDCLNYGSFQEVAANDDSGPGLAGRIFDPCGTVGLIPFAPYYLQVDGFNGSAVSGNITITEVPVGPGAPANDSCQNAIAINCGDSISGNTDCATFDGAPFCGTSNSTNGVWYSIIGDGSFITVTTDNPGTNYDTKLTVYTEGCDSLECVDGDDDGGAGLTSLVGFCSEAGQEYLILVHGFAQSTGDFELSATCSTPLSCDAGGCQSRFIGYAPAEADTNFLRATASGGLPPYTFEWSPGPGDPGVVGVSDDAEGSGLAVQPSVPTIYTATVTDANGCTSTCEVFVDVIDVNCVIMGTSSSGSSDDVPGILVCKHPVATTTSPSNSNSGSGSGSGSSSDDNNQGPQTVCIPTPVTSPSNSNSGSGSGSSSTDDFDPVAAALAQNPLNHLGPCGNPCLNTNPRFELAPPTPCDLGPAIACGDVVLGSTVGDSSEVQPFCGTSDGTGGADWYTFTGTGDDVEITTCNAGTNYDTKLRVYTGSCLNLVCETGDDDDFACGFSILRSTVNFSSVAGETYHVLVHGFSTAEGDYELSVTCTTPKSDGSSQSQANELVSEQGGRVLVTAYPNPFTGSTTISFTLPEDGNAQVQVYNAAGAMVADLFNETVSGGSRTDVIFDASNLPGGVYIYRLTTGTDVHIGRLSVVK